jgi:hypothetical protein
MSLIIYRSSSPYRVYLFINSIPKSIYRSLSNGYSNSQRISNLALCNRVDTSHHRDIKELPSRSHKPISVLHSFLVLHIYCYCYYCNLFYLKGIDYSCAKHVKYNCKVSHNHHVCNCQFMNNISHEMLR